ncbi:hypothetical protein DID88_003235 [Monilinia fructigena]|uniref:U3 small nucleolar ribonucleoprotein protein IMP4 n=1 Tax=Monilinia fructigena TaxID=38457 RepID=A0A395IUR3_9HELO|nr:hypothetical protein DID88_003235 [Monilinia fructigena]
MIRKQARQRRDYLYRRALTLRDAEISEKRAKLRASLASGKPLDPSIANDKKLREDYKYDESRPDLTANEELDLDDEYAQLSGIVDPRIVDTNLDSFKSRKSHFANLITSAQASGLSDIILLHEHRGTPTALTLSHFPHGPTISFSLHNVVLRHDIPNSSRGTVSESYPHLIFEGFTSRLGLRIVKILKHIFPPREAITNKTKIGNRVVTFKNIEDSIEVRHHVFVKTGYQSVELAEVGPRMTMRCFEIRGGTLENKDGDVEWRMNQYTRTSKKKDYLYLVINSSFFVQPPVMGDANKSGLGNEPNCIAKLFYLSFNHLGANDRGGARFHLWRSRVS